VRPKQRGASRIKNEFRLIKPAVTARSSVDFGAWD
jgi:hypothetical protein